MSWKLILHLKIIVECPLNVGNVNELDKYQRMLE